MLTKKEVIRLYETGELRKGSKVKMSGLAGFETFIEIEDVFIKKARPCELEVDWLVVIINGETYDASWIDAIEN